MPKKVFTIRENIESITLTADDVLRLIRREIALMERPAQIERGEIIPAQIGRGEIIPTSESLSRIDAFKWFMEGFLIWCSVIAFLFIFLFLLSMDSNYKGTLLCIEIVLGILLFVPTPVKVRSFLQRKKIALIDREGQIKRGEII